jgi:hypothetical protein
MTEAVHFDSVETDPRHLAASTSLFCEPVSRRSFFSLVALAVLSLLPRTVTAADCKTFSLPGDFKEDGMWSALYAARNGLVYIGAQAHGAEAHFYQYDPTAGKIRHVADMSELAGEKGRGVRIQAKIHTRFVEDKDGIIYFGTGNQGSGPWNIDPRSWGGGHWWAYDPARDHVEDLGVVAKGDSDLYGLAYDPVGHRLYATAYNNHFYVFDLRTRTTIDMGRVTNWDACRTIVADDEGNCYGSFEKHRVFKYDVATNRVLDLPVTLPHDPLQWPNDPARPRLDRKNIWRVVEWSRRDRLIYGVEGGASYLFSFDPHKGESGEIRYLSQLTAPALVGRHDLGYAALSMTIGKDNVIYYAANARAFDYSSEAGSLRETAAYLVSFDPARGTRQDYGKLVDADGRLVLGTQAAACGPDGTLYFFGAVEEKDQSRAVGKVPGGKAFALRLIVVGSSHLRPRAQTN